MTNKPVTMFAPEAPEVLFTDYGSGKLVNGRAYIKLDPIFAKNTTIDASHPLRVFIQLEGDCKGVYVTEKTADGFAVVELDGGQSNVAFMWNAVANRINVDRGNGTMSKYADVRFPANKLHEVPFVEQPLIDAKTGKPYQQASSASIQQLLQIRQQHLNNGKSTKMNTKDIMAPATPRN